MHRSMWGVGWVLAGASGLLLGGGVPVAEATSCGRVTYGESSGTFCVGDTVVNPTGEIIITGQNQACTFASGEATVLSDSHCSPGNCFNDTKICQAGSGGTTTYHKSVNAAGIECCRVVYAGDCGCATMKKEKEDEVLKPSVR